MLETWLLKRFAISQKNHLWKSHLIVCSDKEARLFNEERKQVFEKYVCEKDRRGTSWEEKWEIRSKFFTLFDNFEIEICQSVCSEVDIFLSSFICFFNFVDTMNGSRDLEIFQNIVQTPIRYRFR